MLLAEEADELPDRHFVGGAALRKAGPAQSFAIVVERRQRALLMAVPWPAGIIACERRYLILNPSNRRVPIWT
jgi:hypothetical protein